MKTQTAPRVHKRTGPPRRVPSFLAEANEPDLAHLDTIASYRDPAAPPPQRTPEEQERLDEKAMALRAHGKTFRQIAAELGITVSAAHGRVKRHLYRQRAVYHEHLADIRDYDLLKLQLLEPIVLRNARGGDARATSQFMRLVELRHKLLKIENPTNIEELMRKEDFAHAVAKCYSDQAIEAGENTARTAGEQTGEQGANVQPEPVAATPVAPAPQFFSEPKNQRPVELPPSRNQPAPVTPAEGAVHVAAESGRVQACEECEGDVPQRPTKGLEHAAGGARTVREQAGEHGISGFPKSLSPQALRGRTILSQNEQNKGFPQQERTMVSHDAGRSKEVPLQKVAPSARQELQSHASREALENQMGKSQLAHSVTNCVAPPCQQ